MHIRQSGEKQYEEYTVAIICAIEHELSAVRYMLDQEHPRLPAKRGDSNLYILGQLSGHNVILACLPGSQGKGVAAIVASNLDRTFPSVKWRFVVGIGCGVPSDKHDIRLGDVVISMPEGPHGGVVQYDLGKETGEAFKLKGFLWPPPLILRSAVVMMQSDHLIAESKMTEYMMQMLQRSTRLSIYSRPPNELDILFSSDNVHVAGQASCATCDRSRVIPRKERTTNVPEIHCGLIASGDRVIKSATERNSLAQKLGDVLCFEMEAAGIATEFSCIVIRGISDYGDSHKNDEWHHYASAAAAACVKELLSYLEPSQLSSALVSPSPSDRQGMPKSNKSDTCYNFQGVGIQHSGAGSFSVGQNLQISRN